MIFVVYRFHLKEYPDYKYQPRKRSAATAVGHDTSAGPRSHRRSAVKRLCSRRGRKRPAKLVPRCETPVSVAGSEVSEVAESYLSSDWSVGNDWDEEEEEYADVDVTGSELSSYKPTDHTWSFLHQSAPAMAPPQALGLPVRDHFAPKESVPVLAVGCGRSGGAMAGFDWMEDYMTPEVVDLLADDWFAAADNICLRDVVVM